MEVKGPGDHLSNQQIVWLDVLMRAGADVEICHVVGKSILPQVRGYPPNLVFHRYHPNSLINSFLTAGVDQTPQDPKMQLRAKELNTKTIGVSAFEIYGLLLNSCAVNFFLLPPGAGR